MVFVSQSASATLNTVDDDLENRSISELVSILRTAFRTADFDRVEEVLVAKEVKLKREIENKNKECELLQNKYEFLRLDKLTHEAKLEKFEVDPKAFEKWKETSKKLKKREEELQVLKKLIYDVNMNREAAFEREKKALEQYQKLLAEVEKEKKALEQYKKLLEEGKKTEQDDKKKIDELKSKNSELECAKRAVELDLQLQKSKHEGLVHRISRLDDSYSMLKNGEPVASNVIFESGACSAGSRELVGNNGAANDRSENRTGSGMFASGCIVEISDSDDDHASVENLSGACGMLKRKRDSCLDDCEDYDAGREDEENTILIVRSKAKESLDKARLRTVQNGSSTKHCFRMYLTSGSSNTNKVITSSRTAAVTLRQCEEKVREECKSHNSKFKSSTYVMDYSSDDYSISSESDDNTHNEENNGTNDQRNKCNKKWEFEAEMVAAFEENDELCMEAVCVLYRQSTLKGKPSYFSSRHGGFDECDVQRGTTLALFLTNGDPQGNLMKSVMELMKFDIRGLSDCRRIAIEHSNHLFEIYKNKEDQFLL